MPEYGASRLVNMQDSTTQAPILPRRTIIMVLWLMAVSQVVAGGSIVLIEGAGCRTRQLALQRIFEQIPGVTEVTILAREKAPAENQRYFRINSAAASPSREQLIAALGRRAKFCRVLSVAPAQSAKP